MSEKKKKLKNFKVGKNFFCLNVVLKYNYEEISF